MWPFEPKPPPDTTLSCFALGIIASIQREPNKWMYEEVYRTWRHSISNLCIRFYGSSRLPENLMFTPFIADLSIVEKTAIAQVVELYLFAPLEEKVALRVKEQEEKQKKLNEETRRYFARMGCNEE